MNPTTAIFFDIRLPNAVTWFYFTLLLAVALFFKFSRLLSIRNLDLISLFAPMPGLLLLGGRADAFAAHVWLLAVSGYYFARSLADLALVRRPALNPNLGLGGLAWLAGTLYLSLFAVSLYRTDPRPGEREEQETERPEDKAARRSPGDASSAYPLPAEPPSPNPPPIVDAPGWRDRGLTLGGHLAVALGLLLVGRVHFEDLHAGLAASVLYLLLPYTHFFLPGKGADVLAWGQVWPAALLVWAVLAYRRPGLAGGLVGLAAGCALLPALILPPWVNFYWRRGTGRFLVGFAVAIALVVGLGVVLWSFGLLPEVSTLWPRAAWHPWGTSEGAAGVWDPSLPTHVYWVYRIPVILAYAAFLVATAFWPSPKNLAHVIALTAALLLGIQFWYAGRGGANVFWYLPFLLLIMYRPNLASSRPQEVTR